MSRPLLRIDNAVVRHGGVAAVDGVSLEVHAGEVVALIGANGAGKSSLVGALAGLFALEAGSIHFCGSNVAELPTWRRARLGIGFALEGRRIFAGLTVHENLIAGASGDVRAGDARLAQVFDLFPALRERERGAAWQLSGGQQQMLAVGRALMRDPLLTVLDEPTLGLSPAVTRDVLAAARRVAGAQRAVLIADQNAAQVLRIADRGIVLRRGRVVAAGAGSALMSDPTLSDALLGG